MKFFQNRAVAVILAVIVVLGTLAVSAVRFAGSCRKTEEAFFSVSQGKAPVYYVDQIIGAAASLADVGEKYEQLSDAAVSMRDVRRALVRAEEARDISDIYDACMQVSDAAREFDAQADGVTMSGYDAELTADCVSEIAGAIRSVEESGYNASVSRFLAEKYSSFPASLYARWFSIAAPEPFAPA